MNLKYDVLSILTMSTKGKRLYSGDCRSKTITGNIINKWPHLNQRPTVYKQSISLCPSLVFGQASGRLQIDRSWLMSSKFIYGPLSYFTSLLACCLAQFSQPMHMQKIVLEYRNYSNRSTGLARAQRLGHIRNQVDLSLQGSGDFA